MGISKTFVARSRGWTYSHWAFGRSIDFVTERTRLAIAVITAIAMVSVGGFVAFVVAHRSSESSSPATALEEIASLRRTLQHLSAAEPSRGGVRAIRTVVFDVRGGSRLVRLDAPLWWIQLTNPSGKIRWLGQLTFFDDTEFDSDPIDLSIAQIEKQGPQVLVDAEHSSGARFLCWSE